MEAKVPLVKRNVSATVALSTTRATHRSRRHDPRAAPLSIRKSISIVETCRYYDVADSLTSCRVPRSCYDCLQLPHCALGFNGQCHELKDITTRNYIVDDPAQVPKTKMSQVLVATNDWAVFSGANVTYCNASDPVCHACRTTFETRALSPEYRHSTLDNQYCLGLDKCVCLGICEVPAVWATKAYDRDCAAPPPVYVNPRRVRASSASSVHRDPRAPPQRLLHRRKPDTCEFHGAQDVRGCRIRTNCRDCLERKECMIFDQKCVSMEDYDPELDYRNATRPSNYCAPRLQFPSTNTTYCPLSDQASANCRAQFARTAQNWSRTNQPDGCEFTNTTYCVGSGGCVSIQQCEDPVLYGYDTRGETCNMGSVNAELTTAAMAATFVIVFVMIFIGLAMRGLERRRGQGNREAARQAAVSVMRHMLDQAPVLNLDLYGWRQLQERLYQKEQELLSGAETVSPVSRPVDFEFGGATAPDFEEDDSSAPTATDPHALASAPVFRRDELHEGAHPPETYDQAVPSAPDLTDL